MREPHPVLEASSEAARALPVLAGVVSAGSKTGGQGVHGGAPGLGAPNRVDCRACPGCGRPLTGRQGACSGKCRAALSRRRKARELRLVLEEVLALNAAGRIAIETALARLQRTP